MDRVQIQELKKKEFAVHELYLKTCSVATAQVSRCPNFFCSSFKRK